MRMVRIGIQRFARDARDIVETWRTVVRLTDITIRTLKAPAIGAQIHYDDTLPGFGVRISAKGVKSYVLTHGRQRSRETIGRVGIVGLSDARQAAKVRLAEYTLGKTDTRSVAWNTALNSYLATIKAKRKPRTFLDYDRLLHKHFKFGETKLSDIAPRDIQTRLDKLSDRPAEHQHSFVVLRAFIHWAHQRHYLENDPMVRMKAPHRYKPRERVLSEEELRAVWIAAGEIETFGALIRVLILTGQRRGEIAGLRSDWINKDTATLPAWLTKNSREHSFPLGNTARLMLPTKKDGQSPYLIFPARGRPETSFNGWSKSKDKLDELSGVTNWTIHDLRRTFASGLASISIALPVIERLLNHVSGSFAGIVGVYQRYDFAKEMKDAVDKWDAHVQTLVA